MRLVSIAFERLPLGGRLRFHITRSKLRRSQERVSRLYDQAITLAHKDRKSWDDIQRIESEAQFEWSMAEQEIRKLQTRYYLSCARDLPIETKLQAEEWLEDHDLGGKSLSAGAIARIKQDIRKERMENRQEWLAFVPLLSFLAALIAAVTGLVTVTRDKAPPPAKIILQSPQSPPNPQ